MRETFEASPIQFGTADKTWTESPVREGARGGVHGAREGRVRGEDVGRGAAPHERPEAVGRAEQEPAHQVGARGPRRGAAGEEAAAARPRRAPQARALARGDQGGGDQARRPGRPLPPDRRAARAAAREGRGARQVLARPARARQDGRGGGGRREVFREGAREGAREGRARGARRGARAGQRGAQGADRGPKSRRPGEPLEQAEGRVRDEVARGVRVPPERLAGFLPDVAQLLRVRLSREGKG